jgi:hypothetical protein
MKNHMKSQSILRLLICMSMSLLFSKTSVLFAQAPPNDLCINAQPMSSFATQFCGTTIGATADVPNNGDLCGLGADAEGLGVWYTFSGNGNEWYFDFPASANWDPEVNAYSGTCTNLVCVGGDDDSGNGFSAQFSINTIPGTTYFLYVHDALTSVTGAFCFNINQCGISVIPPSEIVSINCPSQAVAPTPPTVLDGNGVPIVPIGPVITTVSLTNPCRDTITYSYTYCNNQWSKKYNVQRLPPVVPPGTYTTRQCVAQINAPIPPTVLDCGVPIIPTGPVVSSTVPNVSCSGIVFYTWTYTNCAGSLSIYTDTLGLVPPAIVLPTNGVANVQCLADAVPVTPPVISDICGNVLSPSPIAPTTTFTSVCSGTRTYAFRYLNCANQSAIWSFTYTFNDNTPPVITSAVTTCAPVTYVLAPTQTVTMNSTSLQYTATDNCGNSTTVVPNTVTYDCTQAGVPQNFNFTIEDNCGNTATCVKTVNIVVPSISASKAQTSVVPGGPTDPEGHVITTFVIKMKNTGGGTLTNLSLVDNLNPLGCTFVGFTPGGEPSFLSSSASVQPVLNAAYNGKTQTNIFNGTSGTLNAGQEIAIQFTVLMNPNCIAAAPVLSNQAVASAVFPFGTTNYPVTDLSDNGLVPFQSTSCGNGGTDIPTPVYLPSIVVVKSVTQEAIALSCITGNKDVVFKISVKNVGNTPLDQLLLQDFAPLNNPPYIAITEQPGIVAPSNAQITPTVGSFPTLVASSGLLLPGQEYSVDFIAELDPNSTTFQINNAFARGRALFPSSPNPLILVSGPNAITTEDLSDAGVVYESVNPGVPGDTGGHDDPSLIQIPQIHISKRIIECEKAPLQAPVPGNAIVTFEIVIKNTGNVDLINLEIGDILRNDLGGAFLGIYSMPELVASSLGINPTLNPLFNGTVGGGLIASGGTIKQNQVLIYKYTILMDPDAPTAIVPAYSQALVSGFGFNLSNAFVQVFDQSDNGTDPESKNLDYIGTTQCGEDDETPVDVPMILTTKEFLGTRCIASELCSEYVVATFRNRMVNVGNVRLDDLQVLDNMQGQLGPGFVSADGHSIQVEFSSNATLMPIKNTAWDGTFTNPFIFLNTGILDIGQKVNYTYQASVDPSAEYAPFPLTNQTTTLARGVRFTNLPVLEPDNISIKYASDDSDDGNAPLTTNPGFLGDTGGSDDPTSFCAPRIAVQPENLIRNACDPYEDELDWINSHAGAILETCYPIVLWTNDAIGYESIGCGANTLKTYRFTAIDSYGNQICFCRTVTILDNTGPYWDMDPMNKTIACGPNTAQMAQAWLDDAGGGWVYDCGSDVTVTYSGVPATLAVCGTVTVTFTATDACHMSTTATATLTIVDQTPPTITNVPANTTISCPQVPVFGTPSANDNCGSATLTHTDAVTGGPCPLGSMITRTWVATDLCGNTSTSTSRITIVPTSPPNTQIGINCPPNINVTTAAGASTAIVTFGNPTASSTCTTGSVAAVLISGLASGAAFPVGVTTVCYRATDGCSNSTSCCFTVTVTATPPPSTQVSLTCIPNINVNTAAGASTAIVTYANPTASSTCTTGSVAAVLISGPASGAAFPVGVTTVCYRATDGCSNSTSCCFTVTVTATPPSTSVITLIPPPNQQLVCGSIVSFGNATGSSNCATTTAVTITFADQTTGSACAGFTHTRTFTATDQCGTVRTASQVITVAGDTAAPSFASVPQNLTVSCGAPIPSFGSATATDHCSSVSVSFIDQPVTGTCATGLVRRRVFTATDACGNTSTSAQTITSAPDNIAPVFSSLPPQDQMINCGDPFNFGTAVATDACSNPVTVTQTVTNNGTTTCNTVNGITYGYDLYVLWSATDACGNTATANTNIWVLPGTNIAFLSKPGDLQVACNEAIVWTPPMPKSYMASIVTMTHTDLAVLNACGAGTITRRWLATDALDNTCLAEQTATILEDQTAPTISLNAATYTLPCGATPPVTQAVCTDNCTSASDLVVSYQDEIGNTQILRTWIAIDQCGNITNAVETFFLLDAVAPEFTLVPTDLILTCNDAINFGDAIAQDACSDITLVFDDATLTGQCETTYTRTWTATDGSGNQTTAAQKIRVLDQTAPVFDHLPIDKTLTCGQDVIFDDITVNDDCASTTSIYQNDAVSPALCGSTGMIYTRVWTANDGCNNLIQTTQHITIAEDIEAPVFDAFVFYIELTQAEFDALIPSAIATDNCAGLQLIHTDPMPVDQCNYTIDWLASDACGNTTSRTQQIHITDGACAPLSTNDALLKHLFVSPNPFDAYMQLEWQGGFEGQVYYQLFDVLGREVAKDILRPGVQIIDTKSLFSGAYFLQISTTAGLRSGVFKCVKAQD